MAEIKTNTATETANAEYPEKLTTGYYRVRSDWSDTAGQLGAYRKLSNAKIKADENPGYYVFTDDGVRIYPAEDTAEESGETGETDEPAETDEQSDMPSDTPSDAPILYGKLKTLMNIRNGSSLDSEIITTYKKNTIVEIYEVCDNDWYRIKCSESDTGYAYVSNEDGRYAYTGKEVYTVKAGDSLWKIAGEKLGDPKRNGEIKVANGMTSTSIVVGMRLLIP